MSALLTLTEARLKYPRYRQNKRFHEFLYLDDYSKNLGPFDFVVGKIYAVCSVREYVSEDIVQGD